MTRRDAAAVTEQDYRAALLRQIDQLMQVAQRLSADVMTPAGPDPRAGRYLATRAAATLDALTIWQASAHALSHAV